MVITFMSIVVLLILLGILGYLIYLHKLINIIFDEQMALIDTVDNAISDSWSSLTDGLDEAHSRIYDQDYQLVCLKYDFANFLYRTAFMLQDENGHFYPSKYGWTMEEELRLFKLKEYIDAEKLRRGYEVTSNNRLAGLDSRELDELE